MFYSGSTPNKYKTLIFMLTSQKEAEFYCVPWLTQWHEILNTLTRFFCDRVSFGQGGGLHKIPLEIFMLMLMLQKAEGVNDIFWVPQSASSSYVYLISLLKIFNPNLDFQLLVFHPSTSWGKIWCLANSLHTCPVTCFISVGHLAIISLSKVTHRAKNFGQKMR